MRQEEEEQRKVAVQKARERVIEDFEKAQDGFGSKSSRSSTTSSNAAPEEQRGVKRKFELDNDEVDRLAKEIEEETMKKIEQEQAAARKAKLPNFWLVSRHPLRTRNRAASVVTPPPS